MMGFIGALWGVTGVVILLGSAVFRLTPVIIDLFSHPLLWYHWLALSLNALFMAYSEGYRGFQKGFSPRVASRVKYLYDHPSIGHVLLGPFFCIGYFHIEKKRQRVILSLTLGIVVLIMLVRQTAQPWRGIIDAGVVIGLVWGLVMFFVYIVQAFTSDHFTHAPQVPGKKSSFKKTG